MLCGSREIDRMANCYVKADLVELPKKRKRDSGSPTKESNKRQKTDGADLPSVKGSQEKKGSVTASPVKKTTSTTTPTKGKDKTKEPEKKKKHEVVSSDSDSDSDEKADTKKPNTNGNTNAKNKKSSSEEASSSSEESADDFD